MSAVEKKRRRHHTVPQFYLKGFANEAGRIRRTSLSEPERPHIISIGDATVHTDFYMVEDKDGTFDDRIEKVLDKVENDSAVGFRAVLGGRQWPLTGEARASIATWVALQHLRGPSQRQMINDIADSIFKLQVMLGGREGIQEALDDSRAEPANAQEVDDAFAKYTAPNSFRIEMSPNEHIKSMLEQLGGVAFSMYSRPWSIIGYKRKALATSDHPVVLVPAEDSPFLGVGALTAGGIYVPLDRQTALVMGDLPDDPASATAGASDVRFGGNATLANSLNRMMIGNAREAIFTHPDDAHLTSGPLPAPRRQEIEPPDYEEWRGAGEKLRSQRGVQ
jgi:hypothetical protein